MSYFLCQDFSSGLDVRKSPWTSATGSLQTLDDGHITRGGEIEKRKAFTSLGDLLDVTYSLVSAKVGTSTATSLYVFGSGATPAGLPTGVLYQRLQHPDGTAAMTDVVDWTLFNGKPYVVADFSDDTQWHFYDGALVTDWGAGVVRASMVGDINAVAEQLKNLIDASPTYSATRSGSSVIVVGPTGVDYTVSAEAVNGGVISDEFAVVNVLTAAVPGVASVKAVGEFAILIGQNGAGNYIDQVRIDNNGVFTDLISSPVMFNTSPELTALDVVSAININNATHGYVASTTYGKVFIGAAASLGATANGRVIEVTAKGAIVLANGKFGIVGGTAGAGNEVTSVAINGITVTGGAVPWATSNAATAAAVAANINAFASVPKVNAVSLGETVYISFEKVRSDSATTISGALLTGGTVIGGGGSSAPVEHDYGDDYYNPAPPEFPGDVAIP